MRPWNLEDNLPGVGLGAPGAPPQAEQWVEHRRGRCLPPLPQNPGSISGFGQSAQTSASSTRKQPRWSSYNLAFSPSAELTTGDPLEIWHKEAPHSLSPPCSVPSFTERASWSRETPRGSSARHTVVVCITRTPISPALMHQQSAGAAVAPHLHVTETDHKSHRVQSEPPH